MSFQNFVPVHAIDNPTPRVMGQEVREATKVIEKYGWVQKSFGCPDKGFCILGALEFAGNGCINKATIVALAEFLPPTMIRGTDGESMYLCNTTLWNDADGRTKEEVIQYLNKFADELAPLAVE